MSDNLNPYLAPDVDTMQQKESQVAPEIPAEVLKHIHNACYAGIFSGVVTLELIP